MFINNMNQVKMTNGFMIPPVSDYNLNKESESYMNPNMYIIGFIFFIFEIIIHIFIRIIC